MRKALVRVFLVVAAAALPVYATDGVIEINQAKALAGLVTTGDAAGFPVSLNVSGSYRLTGNLDLPSAGAGAATSGIVTGADNISIDLNGFTIIGVPMGSGVGISAAQRAEVSNGFIMQFGGGGINLLAGIVDHVVATYNGVVGIKLFNGLVSNSVVRSTGGDGIWVVSGVIESCTALDTVTGASFRLGTGVLRGSTSNGNNADELYCDANCAYSQNILTCTTDADCFGGVGNISQVPDLSNMCGALLCSAN